VGDDLFEPAVADEFPECQIERLSFGSSSGQSDDLVKERLVNRQRESH